MSVPRRSWFPRAPLLRAYAAAYGRLGPEGLARLPGLGPRRQAVDAARGNLLAAAFLDTASEADFATSLTRFYEACVLPPWHGATLRRRAPLVRYALAYLLRGPDSVARKLDRCLAPDGPYHVAGLGPSFWSALTQGLDPARYPSWTPSVEAGLRRLGLFRRAAGLRPADGYAAIQEAYDQLRVDAPGLTPAHLDHFLSLVALMPGRDLRAGEARLVHAGVGVDLEALVRQERARRPLRHQVKERGRALDEARRHLEAGLAAQDAARVGAALAVADPEGGRRAAVDWVADPEPILLWVGRLWEADDPYERLAEFWQRDPIPRAGLWLPAAVMHLRDPQQFLPADEATRDGFTALDDGASRGAPPAEAYRLLNEAAAWLVGQFSLYPLEVPGVLAAAAQGQPVVGRRRSRASSIPGPKLFGGFCADTFRFLAELEENNCRPWMEAQRDRYRFAVRGPLAELCEALAERYVRPVLCRELGWDLETAARTGQALSSITKNDFGRSAPYQAALWVLFARRTSGARRDDAQFFVRVGARGLSYGVRVGESARSAGRLLKHNAQAHGGLLYRALAEAGALASCRAAGDDDFTDARALHNPDQLRRWAEGRCPVLGKSLAPGDALLEGDDLVGDILLTFDRLVPLFACAADANPYPLLARRLGLDQGSPPYAEADFCRETLLDAGWLHKALALLRLKRQLILQGVPGTGKTHVARCLANVLTRGRAEAVRVVQFHPAYSYEEFVEGIKIRSHEAGGRQTVTYPVEDGVLSDFAARAGCRPQETHVLVIDEINRGNLPRIFGELLYLLEYRDQALVLPYSRREFRLPANLVVLGTMNAADRSVTAVDQALRRRFSFLEMPPDPALLSTWLEVHPPTPPDFARTVVEVFARLNERLRHDLGPAFQIGHSYFMVPDLDESRLRVIWEHHVRPQLQEYFAGHPGQGERYDLDRILRDDPRPVPGSRPRAAARTSV